MLGWLRERHLDRPVREFDRWIDPEIIARRPGESLRQHRRLVQRARQRRDQAIAAFGEPPNAADRVDSPGSRGGHMLRDVSGAVLGAIAAAALLLVVCLVVGAMWLFSWGSFSKATANFRGGVAKTNQINGNGSYRIAAYDHFYDLCATVQTDEVTLVTLLDEQKTATDPTRRATLPASITAARIKRADDINQYNADARKSGTLGQFKASDLPYALDPTEEITTCHA